MRKALRVTAAALEDPVEEDAGDEAEEAEELGIGDAEQGRGSLEQKGPFGVIAAEELGEVPDDRVVDDVDGEHLSVERLAPEEDGEEGEVEEVRTAS
jgi:hypothetical protein